LNLTENQARLIDKLILLALEEDIGDGDHTSLACVPADAIQQAKLLVKDSGILCGMELAGRIAHIVDPGLTLKQLLEDGASIKPGDVAFIIEGSPRSILAAERLILNCMQRMSGIASYTHKLVSLIKDTKSILIDTRKTSPGMRILEKWAVHTGGGGNHRMGLYDMIMIKDNHIDFAGGIKPAISKVKAYLNEKKLNLRIEIEARKREDIHEIMEIGGVDRIMLDNFSPRQISEALPIIGGIYETEASGGINEQNLREYAETGVDFISIGALTHQVKSLDLSLKAFG